MKRYVRSSHEMLDYLADKLVDVPDDSEKQQLKNNLGDIVDICNGRLQVVELLNDSKNFYITPPDNGLSYVNTDWYTRSDFGIRLKKLNESESIEHAATRVNNNILDAIDGEYCTQLQIDLNIDIWDAKQWRILNPYCIGIPLDILGITLRMDTTYYNPELHTKLYLYEDALIKLYKAGLIDINTPFIQIKGLDTLKKIAARGRRLSRNTSKIANLPENIQSTLDTFNYWITKELKSIQDMEYAEQELIRRTIKNRRCWMYNESKYEEAIHELFDYAEENGLTMQDIAKLSRAVTQSRRDADRY